MLAVGFPGVSASDEVVIDPRNWAPVVLHGAQEWGFWDTGNALPKRFCDAPDSEESVKQCAQKLLAEHFGIADTLLAGREWFFDHYTAPDAYFFWTFLRALRFDVKYLDLSKFQNCHEHLDRMKQRASVQKLLAFERQIQEAFAKAA